MRPGLFQILLSAGVILLGHGPLWAQEPTIDPQTIVTRLKAWKASFINLRVVWETRSLPEDGPCAVEEWPPAPDPSAGHLFHRDEWISAKGGLDLLDSRSHYWDPGSTGLRTLEVVNLPMGVGFKANYRRPPEKPEVMLDLSLQDRAPGKVFIGRRMPLDGLLWPGDLWLPEVLEEWDWKFTEIELVNGTPCARIELTESRSKYKQLLWLDPQRDCLVRRFKGSSDLIVDEFQQLEGGVWFPQRGRLQICAKSRVSLYHSFAVTAVELNPVVDRSRFEPPAPEVGTRVSEGLAPNYLRRASHEDPDEAAKDVPVHLRKQGSPATPLESSTSGLLILVGVLAGLLAIGVWLRQSGRA